MSENQTYIGLEPQGSCEPRTFVGKLGGGNLSPKASRHNPIKQGFQEALRAVEMLEGRVSDLVERLSPVCNKIPAGDGVSAKNENAGSSDVYNGLRQIEERVSRATTRIAYLIESLEV